MGGLWRICGLLDMVKALMWNRRCISDPKRSREAKARGFQACHFVSLSWICFVCRCMNPRPAFSLTDCSVASAMDVGSSTSWGGERPRCPSREKWMRSAVQIFVSNMSK